MAAGRAVPTVAARIVAADREVPGKAAATSWANPTATADAQLTSSCEALPRNHRSRARIMKPPTSVAHATGPAVSESLWHQLLALWHTSGRKKKPAIVGASSSVVSRSLISGAIRISTSSVTGSSAFSKYGRTRLASSASGRLRMCVPLK